MEKGPSHPSQEREPLIETRESRLLWLREKLDSTFPGERFDDLRAEVEESFHVPQMGEYHNEGAFMDSHLKMIFDTIEDLRQGNFPEILNTPEFTALRDTLRATMAELGEQIEKYVFLHDVAKKDCLLLRMEDGTKKEISWDDWQEMLADSSIGIRVDNGEEAALAAFCKQQGIVSIGYFHPSEGGAGQHGAFGANTLKQFDLIGYAMQAAIRLHEVAFKFNGINAELYDKTVRRLDAQTQDFVLLATYLDNAASLRKDGKPGYEQFISFANSRRKSNMMQAAKWRTRDLAYDQHSLARTWHALYESKEMPESVEAVIEAMEPFRIKTR